MITTPTNGTSTRTAHQVTLLAVEIFVRNTLRNGTAIRNRCQKPKKTAIPSIVLSLPVPCPGLE